MICNGCEQEVAQSMRYAIANNACPFCGDSILTQAESVFRNSVSRVLIKNGLENQRAIDSISNQVLEVFQAATLQPSRPSRASKASVLVDEDEDEDMEGEEVSEMDDDGEFGPSAEDIRIANEDKVVFTEQPSKKAQQLRVAAKSRQKLLHIPVRRLEP